MSTKIHVGGLSHETTEAELQQFFTKYGTINSVNITAMKKTADSKGIALVEMASAEEAQKAITVLNGKELGGRRLTINQARPQEDRSHRPGEKDSFRRY